MGAWPKDRGVPVACPWHAGNVPETAQNRPFFSIIGALRCKQFVDNRVTDWAPTTTLASEQIQHPIELGVGIVEVR